MFKSNRKYSPYLCSRRKRCFDLLILLLVFLPAMMLMLVVATAIWLSDRRPVLFVHERVGRFGRSFPMPKFRTLHKNSLPYEPSPQSINDERIIGIGKYLRKHRLDELPQLFCVLSGSMSLVGPRPEQPQIAALYTPYHTKRLTAKPGLTGLWQLFGNRTKPIHHSMKFDLYYMRKASLWFDIKILIMTLGFIINPNHKSFNYEDCIYSYQLAESN